MCDMASEFSTSITVATGCCENIGLNILELGDIRNALCFEIGGF